MDLRRLSNEKKLQLCKSYFKVGFAFLPFVWAVNAFWFFNEAFRRPPYDEQKQLKKYVIYSSIGAAIWASIFITWIIVFQINRVNWGEVGDNLSFIIPVGRA